MSKLEDVFAKQLEEHGIAYRREVRCIPGRRFRFDFEVHGLLVEIQGGGSKGAHGRFYGYERDCAKGNLAQAYGFKVFHFTSRMVTSGEAVRFLAALLRGRIDGSGGATGQARKSRVLVAGKSKATV